MTTVTASNNIRRTSRQLSHSGRGSSLPSGRSGIEVQPSFPTRPSHSSTRSGSSSSIQNRGSFSSAGQHSVTTPTNSRHGAPPGLANRRPSLAVRQASAFSSAASKFDASPITPTADTTSAIKLRNITPEEVRHFAEYTDGKRTFGYKPDYLATAQGLSGVPSNFMVDFFIQTETGLLPRSIRLSECGSTDVMYRKDAKCLIPYLSRVMSALDGTQTVLPLPGLYLLDIEFPFGLGKPHAAHAKFLLNWYWADPQATIKEGYLTELHKNTLPRGKSSSYKALIEARYKDGSKYAQYVPWDDLAEQAALPAAVRGTGNRVNILKYLGTTNQIGNTYCYSDWRIREIKFNLAGHYLGSELVDATSDFIFDNDTRGEKEKLCCLSHKKVINA